MSAVLVAALTQVLAVSHLSVAHSDLSPPPPCWKSRQHLTEHPTGVSQNPRRSEAKPMAEQGRRQSVDRHEPAPVCEPSVLEASRAIIFDHLHKPPDPELGKGTSRVLVRSWPTCRSWLETGPSDSIPEGRCADRRLCVIAYATQYYALY